MTSVTLKVGGATWGHFGRIYSFYLGASNMSTHFFSKSIQSSGAQLPPCPTRKTIPPKFGIICEKILAPTLGQLMRPPPKTSNANLTRNPTCLKQEVFICYFGAHDSGHHPTPVDTFHPHRLPPSRSQTPSKH